MVFPDFEALISRAKSHISPSSMAIIAAAEPHVIDATLKAYHDGIIDPIFIGDPDVISALLRERNALGVGAIAAAATSDDCAAEAVRLVHSGEAECLMKGLIETGPMMKILMNKESGILGNGFISGLSINSIPTYPKLLGITDPAINIFSSNESQVHIKKNAENAFRLLGYDAPKTVVLNTSSALSAAFSQDILPSNYPDILLMPDLTSANILSKSIRSLCRGTTAGILLGLHVPMGILSRSADTNSKYTSIAVVAQMV